MHADGYRGEEISIAIFDSGFQGVNTTAPFSLLNTDNRIKQAFNFVSNHSNVFVADDHGTEVLSVMAAYTEGSYTGGAYMANYFCISQKTFLQSTASKNSTGLSQQRRRIVPGYKSLIQVWVIMSLTMSRWIIPNHN